MLDYAFPEDDRYHDSDDDSSISIADPELNDTIEISKQDTIERLSTIDDCKRVAVKRAKYFRRKYAAERVLATGLFVLTSPLLALLVGLVRLTSKGPGIYRQKRVGLHGETFFVYKLRSMYIDAEKGGKPVWCGKNDSRITPLGKVLRKTHLDEIPQLWNVVKGEMSLTGPRPERPEICEVLATFIDDYYHRNVVKPGITGLAQINLEPDETIADVKRKQYLDLHYIKTANLWLDLRMLLATALRIFFIKGDRAMRMLNLSRRSLVVRGVEILPGDERKPFADESGSALTQVGPVADNQHDSSQIVNRGGRHLPR